MIATQKDCRRKRYSPRWNDRFLELLPAIQDQAEFAFRRVPSDAREELVQETVATAYGMFMKLCRRGKTALVYPTPLCKYAVRHVRAGRRIGSPANSLDITSPCTCTVKRITIERLDRFDPRTGDWREAVVEDHTAGPAEIAATRLDFSGWLTTLSARDRELAETLAIGETTGRVARTFRISAARVSQLRRELCANWHRFVGELADATLPSVATA
jgi:DNA-binding CsgD family transcriptional regulator